jgi:hypothetical protein
MRLSHGVVSPRRRPIHCVVKFAREAERAGMDGYGVVDSLLAVRFNQGVTSCT